MIAFAVGAYRLLLLVAAYGRLRQAPPPAGAPLEVGVLVPAHDEAAGIEATLASLQAMDPPAAELVVIADNCTDATAAIARAAGARVLERDNPEHRGKGHALAWALDRCEPRDVVLIVDADCTVSANLAGAVAARIAGGARAVQADYRVANPDEAPLRYAGFLLQNTIRTAGRARLGLSAGLTGSGMAFAREVAQWRSFSLAEDREQYLRLAADGVRVDFAQEARVESAMPGGSGSRAQQQRWESGRLALLRELGPRLVARGQLDAALDPLLPPQAVVAALNLLGLARRQRIAVASTGMQVALVLGGMRAAGAPPSVYRALLGAPMFVARRLALLASRDRPRAWVRTERP